MKTPEVRIYFSWLLYENVSVKLHEALAAEGEVLISQKVAEEYAANYRHEWAKYDNKILLALVEIMGMEFYQSVIDVPCAPWVRSMSNPLTMGYKYFPNQFVDILMHELCHVLLTDNTMYSMKSSKDIKPLLGDRWKKLFGEEYNFTAAVHIPVHALSKYIYLDVLEEPERLERDIEHIQNNPPYVAAWDYVQAHDYHEIIDQLKADYKALAGEG
ncbi:MAG TPA: hypothetical protein VLE99_02325 [Candidatus Saccharimonadales bacterium]|nr:hypothetical protein [Candidatus Saccharimonadales bacterium]